MNCPKSPNLGLSKGFFFFNTNLVSRTSINAVIRLCAQNQHLSLHQPVTKGTALLKAPSHTPSGNCPKRAEGPFQHTPHSALQAQPTPGLSSPTSLPQQAWGSPSSLTNREISFSSHTCSFPAVPGIYSPSQIIRLPKRPAWPWFSWQFTSQAAESEIAKAPHSKL